MTNDGYLSFANSGFGGWMTGALGLPRPLPLDRRADVGAGVRGPILMGPDGGDRFTSLLDELARADGVEIHREAVEETRYGALVFDASDCVDGPSSRRLYDFFHGSLRRLGAQGRIVVLARPIEEPADVEGAAIQRGLEGFVRSLAKEAGRGATAQLIRVEAGAETAAAGTLAFFLSSRSAYVSGQVVEVGKAEAASRTGHQGRKVLVTGAARGIGEAIARLFAAEGARVIALDTAHGEEALRRLSTEIGADPLVLDITASDATSVLAADASARGGYDVVIHNAGITRDKTLARMESGWWDAVMAVNLTAPLALTRALLDRGLINSGGRIVAVSSLSGIAGNRGQSNYALSKAAWIGAVRRLSRETGGRITVNAVAPGFIETEMTAAIPFAIREAGRRMNSLGQGGQPVDVAETIAWLAEPSSAGVNGQVVRVCGQSLLGA